MPPPIEPERYQAAWKARQQRQWIYLLLLAALVAVTMVAQTLLVVVASLTGMLCATYWFNQFRCPRCGKIFNPNWAREVGPFSGKLIRCSHCGLELDEIPGAKQ